MSYIVILKKNTPREITSQLTEILTVGKSSLQI